MSDEIEVRVRSWVQLCVSMPDRYPYPSREGTGGERNRAAHAAWVARGRTKQGPGVFTI